MRVAIADRDAGEGSYEEKYQHHLLRLKSKPPGLASISLLKSVKSQLFLKSWCEFASRWRIEVLS
jgi:hypothetical protein